MCFLFLSNIFFVFCSKSPAATGGVKPTTLVPAAGESTADVTGQNLKKAQSKKTKRGENKDL